MTLPIKICLIGSEPLYSKEYHLHKRENGKIQMYFRQILQKNNCCNILGNNKIFDFMHEINWKKRDFICKKHSLYQYYML